MATRDNKVINGSNLGYFWQKIRATFWGKDETTEVSIDSTPTANSTNVVTSGGIKVALDNKQDILVSGSNIKTINNETLLGSGNIETIKPIISTNVVSDRNDDTRASSPKSVYNFVKPASQSAQPAGGMLPNVLYKLGTLTGNVTINLASATDATIENEYKFTFTAGSTAPTITWPASITGWAGNCLENGVPVIADNCSYEVSILEGLAIIVEVA